MTVFSPKLVVALMIIGLPYARASADIESITSSPIRNVSDWQISMSSDKEFCTNNLVTINILDGTMVGYIGACDPRRSDPPRTVSAISETSEIIALRKLTAEPIAGQFSDIACENRESNSLKPALSGGSAIVIRRGKQRVVINPNSPCLTNAGRTLSGIVNRTIVPLYSLGYR